MLYLILSFVAGSIIIISMTLNSRLSEYIGLLQGTLINFLSGLLPAIVYFIINYKSIDVNIGVFSKIPIWMYLGGVVGVLVVCFSNFVMPKIPTIYTTLLIFIGQLFVGTIVDYYSNVPISKFKLLGGALIIAGLFYNFRVDKKYLSETENLENKSL